MKRKNNLYEKIYSLENLQLADSIARKGKSGKYDLAAFDENKEENILKLQQMLINKTYQTSEYTTFKVYEPKERIVSRLPYFPDRIAHHAIMNILEPIFVACFTADTYSCIKGKGIHAGVKAIKHALKDKEGTKYCLQLDIQKFYPNVDHDILKQLLRKKIKDQDLLWLLDEIIDSAPGLPIGNLLSQYFANFYMTYFDHWIKEQMGVKRYFRYADDIAIFHSCKEYLHKLFVAIKEYFFIKLKLLIKRTHQVFPVAIRGLNMLGYVFFPNCTFLRKKIKQNFARMLARRRNKPSTNSYIGWASHCDSKHLLKKLLYAQV
jgi:retron-type reverse transcriptase